MRGLEDLSASRDGMSTGTPGERAATLGGNVVLDTRRTTLTRAHRRRTLPTDHGHAARPSATRGYQSDSLSKRPDSSRLSRPESTGPPRARTRRPSLDMGSLHISVEWARSAATWGQAQLEIEAEIFGAA